MDFYLNKLNSANRLLEEYNQHKSLVVAFDFDDTVYDFHKKSRTYPKVITLLSELKSINCHLICWTGQEDLEFVQAYLRENEIPFDSINEHPPFYKSDGRKVYANAYLDDRAGLHQVYQELKLLVNTVLNREINPPIEAILEKIHNMWSAWAQTLLQTERGLSAARIDRWNTDCFLEYNQLSEDMKNLDRKFAYELLEII